MIMIVEKSKKKKRESQHVNLLMNFLNELEIFFIKNHNLYTISLNDDFNVKNQYALYNMLYKKSKYIKFLLVILNKTENAVKIR